MLNIRSLYDLDDILGGRVIWLRHEVQASRVREGPRVDGRPNSQRGCSFMRDTNCQTNPMVKHRFLRICQGCALSYGLIDRGGELRPNRSPND